MMLDSRRKGPQGKESGWPLEAGKAGEWILPQSLQKGRGPVNTSTGPMRLIRLRRKIINLFGFQLHSLWLTAALGEESGAPGEGGDGLRGRRKLGQQCLFEN